MNIRDNLKMPKGKGDIIKKIPAGLPAVSWVLLPCGCGSTLNGVLGKEHRFSGVVREIYENAVWRKRMRGEISGAAKILCTYYRMLRYWMD